MNILVVSNLFPPHYIGGYELGCRDVVEGLRDRGHSVSVLTSSYGLAAPVTKGNVERTLTHCIPLPKPLSKIRAVRSDRHNRNIFRKCLSRVRPDVIYLWNLGQLSASIPLDAERSGITTCYFISDNWLTDWPQNDELGHCYQVWPNTLLGRGIRKFESALFGLAGSVVNRLVLPLRYVHFASQYLAQQLADCGKSCSNPTIIHWGVDLSTFFPPSQPISPRKMLFSGQVIAEKGPHVAVEAIRILSNMRPSEDFSLTIVGGSLQPDYLGALKEKVAKYSLQDRVIFLGFRERSEMPDLYRDYGCFMFTSIYNEPFSIALVEAMATGMCVIGTLTGGSPELLKDGINAYAMPADDPEYCARRIAYMLDNPTHTQQIRNQAVRDIDAGFSISHMVAGIEAALTFAIRDFQQPHRSSSDLVMVETASVSKEHPTERFLQS